MKKKLFWGIREKISLCYILASILLLLCTTLTVYRIYRRDIVAKERTYMEDENEILSYNIYTILSAIEEKLVTELEYCSVFSYQDNLNNSYPSEVERNLKSLTTLMKMRGVKAQSIYVMDKYGCSFYYDTDGTQKLADFKQKKVYREIKQKRENLFPRQGSTLWRRYEENPDEIYMIKHYISTKTSAYKGIVAVTYDRAYLSELLGDHEFASLIYDETGSLLYYDDALETSGVWQDETQLNNYLVSSATVRKKGWTLMALVDKRAIMERMWGMSRMLLAVGIVSMIGAGIVSTILFRRMLQNITALSQRFRDIHAGKTVTLIETKDRDETGWLCEEFNSMYRELERSVEKMAHDETLRERAEYNALLAQMNPHFLYNSLESISSMAKLSGQEEIVRVIQRLVYLLRASIGGIHQKITLREELRYISCYLEMQKLVSGGGRLEWDIAADEEVLDCLVPKLILQPVAENAIIHGLWDSPEEGIIVITAARQENTLVLELDDNGRGAKQEEIDALLAGDEEPPRDRAHIGIRSILKRIQILYGENYGMKMKSEPGNGMSVCITLPLEKEGG